MAVHHRNTASSLAQEPPLTIARVAVYARVSTCTGQDPEMQLRELREYASRRSWSITREYVDQGVSGSRESRRQLNQLMTDAHRRSTALPPRPSATLFPTPRRKTSRLKSTTTMVSSDYVCATMEKVSIRQFSPIRAGRGTMACLA